MKNLKNILFIFIVFLFYSCSPENYEGNYRSANGSFLRLKSANKFEFGIAMYPELFTGIYKSIDKNIEIIFRYPFYGRDAITTLSMKIEGRKEIQILRLAVDAENLRIKIDKTENRAYISINGETNTYVLTDTQTQERLGIFYTLTQAVFVKQ